MGEYASIDGHEVKLGTCESMYYVRRDEVALWAASGRFKELPGNAGAEDYLRAPLHWRFPFPHEDGQKPGDAGFENRRYTDCVTLDAGGLVLDHSRVAVRVPVSGGWETGVSIPCPFELGNVHLTQPIVSRRS